MDGSVFRFHRSTGDGPQQPTYAASVIKAGAAHIEMSASSRLADTSKLWFKKMKENEGKSENLFLDEKATLDHHYQESLREIEKEVKRDLIHVFKEAHEKEVGESHWTDLQLVIGGGGSSIPSYVTAATAAFSLKGRGGAIPRSVLLEAPSDFEMGKLSRKVFHRFAVAYGLSFPYASLPEVVLANEVEPMPPGGSGRIRGPITDPTQDD